MVMRTHQTLRKASLQSRSAIILSLLILPLFLSIGGCGEEEKQPEDKGSGREDGYRVVEVESPGTITGTITLLDRSLSPPDFSEADPAPICRGALENNRLEVGPEGGIAWGVVRLVGLSEGKAFDESSPTIDQVGCRYEPHVVVARRGGRVDIRNGDPTAHNVRVEGENGMILLNVAQPSEGDIDPFEVSGTGPFLVGCDYHPWMNAYIFGVDNPYVAVSGADGSYAIEGIPPGEYELRLWLNGFEPIPRFDNNGALVRYRYSTPHEVSRRVRVEKNGTTTEDFQISGE